MVCAQVPESRAVKRRPVPLAVPASSACSEGGRSDSSAKSAPGPPPHMHWQHAMQQQHQGPSMLAAALGPPGARHAGAAAHHQQQQGHAVDGPVSGGPAGDIHPGALGPINMGMSMPMAPPFFPPGCMPGMMMGGQPGCPPAPCMPFMPPWAMNPAMMQSMMFGGGLPMPPLPMPPPGMMLPMPFMPGMGPMSGMMGPAGAAAEPAAGIPVSGPLPPAGNAFRAAGSGPASKESAGTAAASKQAPAPAVQAAPLTPAAAAAATPQPRPASQQQQPAAVSPAMRPAVSASGSAGDMLPELEQLDVVALRPWVVSHFCEDVYLLLLDVWRPDSAKVREAIWAWKLHVKAPRPAGAQPDYRAFLVSLFGLDKLTQLSAAAQAARQGSSTLTKVASSAAAPAVVAAHACMQAPAAAQEAPAVAAAVKAAEDDCALRLAASAAGMGEGMTPEHEAPSTADCEAAVTTSNLSSEPGAALTAPGPHVMSVLVPGSKAMGGASATSPHRARLELQQQQQPA